MHFPWYTTTPKPQTKAIDLPYPLQSASLRPEAYLPDEGLVDAVNVALLLGQPLLLTGEPGTGKTQLAYSLAYQLGLEAPLKFETKSTSTAQDLFYIYDALGRFQAAQWGEQAQTKSIHYITYNALGLAIILTHPQDKLKAVLPPDFIHPGVQRSIVLVDEIDKAPRDFPNDVLSEVEQLYFRIPELGNIKIQADPTLRPILVLTSNSEKHLPDAFLRRCVYYHIPFPEKERLTALVEAHLGTFTQYSNTFLADALEFFFKLRASGLRKKPATAELLNWLLILRELFKETQNPILTHPDKVMRTLSSLVKTEEDQAVARQILQTYQQ
ncbi:MAG: MoxR family ATPase [Pseudomonadota bacterium]|nr:MoxR family ATPase [Pseudomonadota bacterium]